MDNSGGMIYRAFKVYSITDKLMVNDTGRQSYMLHFCSPEIFIDTLSPVYNTFGGTGSKIQDVVKAIYDNFLASPRTGDGGNTDLIMPGSADNMVKFTSPGWTPMRCINFLASKSIGSGYANPGYLFFESNKAFYFVNVEQIFDLAIQSKSYFQDYIYVANNITQEGSTDYVKDIDKEYKKAVDMQVIESYNSLRNARTGYLSNRLITFDMLGKKLEVFDYDHRQSFGAYKHLEDIEGKSKAPFVQNALTAPAGHTNMRVKHNQLYTNVKNNIQDRIKDILPYRTSTLNELNNFKIEITVPGRTDIEVGVVVKFTYPNAQPRSDADKNTSDNDTIYTGYYLVTAVRHKITLLKHMMVLELVKESIKG
jgi:hypothetical protein